MDGGAKKWGGRGGGHASHGETNTSTSTHSLHRQASVPIYANETDDVTQTDKED